MYQFMESNLTIVNFLILAGASLALLLIVLGFVTYAIYGQRKILGWMQGRHGPTEVGPFGLLQTPADVLKLLLKEDIIHKHVDRPLFLLAPIVAFAPSFFVMAVFPFTENIHFAAIGVGVLYYIAIPSISNIGVLMAGWSSNNKWALISAMRAVAMMISYEVPLLLSVVGVVMLAGTMNFIDIVHAQQGMWFIIPQFLGFIVFLIASFAELNRTPFDLAEAESELIAGYMTEYSGFRFAFFMLAEYTYLFAFATVGTVLFLGGWLPPFEFLSFIPGIIWFILKFSIFIFLPFWAQASFPRLRIDQLMTIGWKVLLPLSLLNIFITALFILIF